MTIVEIDADKAIALLEQAVAQEDPYFVYRAPGTNTSCQYVRAGKPDCGVGRALVLAGVPIETLSAADGAGCSAVNDLYNSNWWADHEVSLTREAVTIFRCFQWMQDTCSTWGRALNFARTKKGEVSQW